MNIFNWFSHAFFSQTDVINTSLSISEQSLLDINPANGLPMVGGIGGIDISGNIFGSDDLMCASDAYVHEVDSGTMDYGNDFSNSFDSSSSMFD